LTPLELSISKSGYSRLKTGLLLKQLKKVDVEKLYRLSPPELRYRLCCARMYLGDFSNYSGWEFRDEGHWSEDLYYKEFKTPKWGGGYVPRLVVMGEQGLGDQIIWASVLPECRVRVKEVIYECDPRLHKIIERSLGVHCRDIRSEGISEDCDAYIPGAELLRMFRTHKSHFPKRPFLKPDQERVAGFERFRGRVGFSWKGRQGSIEIPEKNYVSLQYDDASEKVEDPQIDLKNDIEGVFALCSVLDSVVTVPTSILHIAGSIGKKVEVIEPKIKGEIENQIRWEVPPVSFIYPDVRSI
jgi:hypothetical protein